MTDIPEPEDLYDDLEPEGQESEPLDFAFEDELNTALHKGINSKSHPGQPGEVPDPSPRARNPTGRVADADLEEDALEDGELEEILASLFEEPKRRPAPARPPQSIAQQAAALVARQGRFVSTAAVFKDGAARVSGAAESQGSSLDEKYASSALLENDCLVQAMTHASARAANEKEAGLLAATSVPLMMQDYPSFYRGLWPAIPALSAGADVLARFLYRSERLRPLVSGLPVLLRGVIKRLARELSSGQPITSQMTANILAKYTEVWLAARTAGQTTRRQAQGESRLTRAPRMQEEE